MKKGINYDTGFLPEPGTTRRVFERETVRREMRVIAGDLHCQAVRVSGGNPERLSAAAEEAAAAGLEVYFAPFPVDLTTGEMLDLYAECARRAQAVDGRVILVTGCETSAFGRGFMPGDTYTERLEAMADSSVAWWENLGPIIERLNAFLAEAAATARKHFDGPITYASAPWEPIDWTPFDLVGVDAYRAGYNEQTFPEEIRAHRAHGKPVIVTEFGTCAYQGAAQLGGMAWQPPAGAVPDEQEQVRYLDDLLDVFEQEGVDTALWFTFASYTRPGAGDLGSYGVVRMLDETSWEPKAAFHAMARRYS
ncbi:hypothetical protein [Nonomuraea typhae]|uniref:Asl1-like glycosyl hydrolase catalytic domain-containing protein n=1 Tax=Nonomuraea typhae TaxID=2603600 RepID=A0ABW7YMU1_9ACTN